MQHDRVPIVFRLKPDETDIKNQALLTLLIKTYSFLIELSAELSETCLFSNFHYTSNHDEKLP